MSKLLSKEEVEEIISTMCAERDLATVSLSFEERGSYGKIWVIKQHEIKHKRFLWWKWTSQDRKGTDWFTAPSLISAVNSAEDRLKDWDAQRAADIREAAAIRQKHAARLLDKKLGG